MDTDEESKRGYKNKTKEVPCYAETEVGIVLVGHVADGMGMADGSIKTGNLYRL